MLDRSQNRGRPAPRRAPPPSVLFAKWPPDDDDVPAGPPMPAGGGGGGGSYDGDFKRGRFSPIAIVIGLLCVVGLGIFIYFGVKSEGEKLTAEQIAKEKRN